MSVDVLLARTHSPGNLGSAARACKAFGARLLLLDPRADAAHEDAGRSPPGAEDLLDPAPRLSSWEEAEEGASALLALTSLRGRSARGLPPAWSWAAARRVAREGRLVLAFGPERSGLTTDEVRRAAGRLAFPTRPEFPVLNLAQAVAASLALLAAGRPGRAGRDRRRARRGAGDLRRLREELPRPCRRPGTSGATTTPSSSSSSRRSCAHGSRRERRSSGPARSGSSRDASGAREGLPPRPGAPLSA